MGASRTENSLRNAVFSVFGYVLNIALTFAVRTFFINYLKEDYLGVNGLFTNILSMLNLAEMGLGTAIIFKLYKPLASNDTEKIKQLMSFYKTAYRIIALIIAVVGLCLLPFLQFLIKESPDIAENMKIVYLLYLTNSVVSYLLIYKKSLIVADQKEYLTSIINYAYLTVMSVAQILILVFTHNFLLFLIVQIFCSILQNVVISLLCDKKYPYIVKNKSKLPKEDQKPIFKDVRALVLYRISAIVINGTDNIIMSKFIGLTIVGIYSNYYLIVHSVFNLIKQFVRALGASVGNMSTTKDVEKKYLVYNSTNLMNSWLIGTCSICFFVILNPFIALWAGDKLLLSELPMFLIVFNFYITGIAQVFDLFRNSFGLFVQGQLRPVISSIINLVLSIILVQYMGIVGVLLGTTAAQLSINIWYDPLVVHRHVFKRSPFPFYMRNLLYLLLCFLNGFICKTITSFIKINSSVLELMVKAVVVFVLSNLIFLGYYFRTKEFKFLKQQLLFAVKKLLKK